MNQQLNRHDPLDAADLAGRFIRPRHASTGIDRWQAAQPGQRRFVGLSDQAIARAGCGARRDDRDNGCCTPDDEHARLAY